MSENRRALDGNTNDLRSTDSLSHQLPDEISGKDSIQPIEEHEKYVEQKRCELRNQSPSIISVMLRSMFELNRWSQQGTVGSNMEIMQYIIQRMQTSSTSELDPSASAHTSMNPVSESSAVSTERSEPTVSEVETTTSNSSPSFASTQISEPITPVVQATNSDSRPSSVSSEPSVKESKTPRGLSMQTKKYQENIAQKANEFRQSYEKVNKERQMILRGYTRNILNVLRPDTCNTLIKDLSEFFSGAKKQIANQPVKVENREERLVALSSLAKGVCDQLLGSDMNETKASVFLPFIQQISQLPNQDEFQTIFLDFLYRTCPYTVPRYPEYPPNATQTEKLKAMGYVERREEGNIRLENDVEFLNRMTGLIRLFCKLLACGKPPIGADRAVAWRWIADLLNMEPVEDLSAILIRVFLCEVGNTMRQYNKNFEGLVKLIKTDFMEKLKPLTSNHEMELLRQTLVNW